MFVQDLFWTKHKSRWFHWLVPPLWLMVCSSVNSNPQVFAINTRLSRSTTRILSSPLILFLNVYLSFHGFTSSSHVPVPVNAAVLTHLLSFPFSWLLPSLVLRCAPCLPMWIIHGLWGFGCGERIRSLAWAVFLSVHLLGPSRSHCLACCWEEYWVTSFNTLL